MTALSSSNSSSVLIYAFFWAWSMINNRLVAEKSELTYAGPVPAAPLNRIVMLTDYVAPDERMLACRNQDVVYGVGSLGMEKSPVVIQVPDFGNGFWTLHKSWGLVRRRYRQDYPHF